MLPVPLLVTGFADFLKKIGKKEATIQSYSRDVSQFLDFLNSKNLQFSSLDRNILSYYQTHVREYQGGRQNSLRRSVIAIRQFFRLLPKFNSEFAMPSFTEFPIPSRVEVLAPSLKQEELQSLFSAARQSSDLKAARDQAILACLSFEGIKVSELISLEWKHYLTHRDKASLFIPGERKRTIVLGDETFRYLEAYWKVISNLRPLASQNYKMFVGFKGREILSISPQVTRHGLKFMLYELGQICNISHLNTELLRHHAIRHQVALGLSSESIMLHLGLKRIGNIAQHLRK